MGSELGTDQDHVVKVDGVGIYHGPATAVPRPWQDHKKGERLTPEDLEHTDVARLVQLGALKPAEDEEEPEEGSASEAAEDEGEEDYAQWSKDALVEEAGNRGLPVSGTKAELAQRLEEHDASEAQRVPESTGASEPEAN